MTGQLHHLIARQQIAESQHAASKARLVTGERRRIKLIVAVLSRFGVALTAGAPAMPRPRSRARSGLR